MIKDHLLWVCHSTEFPKFKFWEQLLIRNMALLYKEAIPSRAWNLGLNTGSYFISFPNEER